MPSLLLIFLHSWPTPYSSRPWSSGTKNRGQNLPPQQLPNFLQPSLLLVQITAVTSLPVCASAMVGSAASNPFSLCPFIFHISLSFEGRGLRLFVAANCLSSGNAQLTGILVCFFVSFWYFLVNAPILGADLWLFPWGKRLDSQADRYGLHTLRNKNTDDDYVHMFKAGCFCPPHDTTPPS